MRQRTIKARRILALSTAPIERLERRSLLSSTTFTLVPTQSVLTLNTTLTYDGLSLKLSSQGTSNLSSSQSSLQTEFSGTVLANVGSGTLQFMSGSSISALNNGAWKPGLNPGATGNATATSAADLAGQVAVIFEGTEYVAVRGLVFDANSPVLNQSSGSYPTQGQLGVDVTAGDIYYDGVSGDSGETSLIGDTDNNESSSPATLTTNGSTQTLTVPVSITLTQNVSSSLTVTSVFTGSFVATSTATTVQGSPSYYLKLDADKSHIDVYNNSTGTGTPTQFLYSQTSSMVITTTGGAGSVTIDNSAGTVIPSGGIKLTGDGSTSLTVLGSGEGDTVAQNAGQIVFNGLPIAFTGVTTTTLNPIGGTDSLAVNSGKLLMTATPTGGGIRSRLFSNITIGVGAQLQVLTPTSHSDRAVLVVNSLSIAGTTNAWTGLLDLGGNDMDLQTGSLATVSNMAAAGYNFGQTSFQAEGLTSSSATGDTTHLTALGVIQNNQGGTAIYGNGAGQSSFEGVVPGASDILIKFTYFGDVNLDGKINGTDYSRIDNGFNTAATGWFNGDFNYDGLVNGRDYTLIDNSFNRQSTSLAAAVESLQVARPAVVAMVPADAAKKSIENTDWESEFLDSLES